MLERQCEIILPKGDSRKLLSNVASRLGFLEFGESTRIRFHLKQTQKIQSSYSLFRSMWREYKKNTKEQKKYKKNTKKYKKNTKKIQKNTKKIRFLEKTYFFCIFFVFFLYSRNVFQNLGFWGYVLLLYFFCVSAIG